MNLPFSSEPCQFDQAFQAFVVDKNTGEEHPLPAFMALVTRPGPDRASLFFNVTDGEDTGEYSVKVYSELQNYFKNTTSVEFLVVVYE